MRPSVAALSVLSGYQGALSIQRYESYIDLSTTHCCPAGARILRASSDSIHSNNRNWLSWLRLPALINKVGGSNPGRRTRRQVLSRHVADVGVKAVETIDFPERVAKGPPLSSAKVSSHSS